jgi:hypothetical protein
MNYSNLGRTGLKVSRIGLGTMNFGMETSEADSLAVLAAPPPRQPSERCGSTTSTSREG